MKTINELFNYLLENTPRTSEGKLARAGIPQQEGMAEWVIAKWLEANYNIPVDDYLSMRSRVMFNSTSQELENGPDEWMELEDPNNLIKEMLSDINTFFNVYQVTLLSIEWGDITLRGGDDDLPF